MARGGARTGAGRPRGSKSHEYQTILASKAPVAIARLVELATKEEPNMQALKMLIDRVVPQLKPVSPPVTFSLDAYTGDREHPYWLNVNTVLTNVLASVSFTAGVHLPSTVPEPYASILPVI